MKTSKMLIYCGLQHDIPMLKCIHYLFRAVSDPHRSSITCFLSVWDLSQGNKDRQILRTPLWSHLLHSTVEFIAQVI